MARPLVLFFAACLFCLSAADEHKGVTYKAPAGWLSGMEGEAKVFTPKGLKESEVVAIILTPAVDATADPVKKQFEEVTAAANDGSKILAKGEPEIRTAADASVCVQALRLDSPAVGVHSRIYVLLVSKKKRALALILIKPDELASKYESDITAFIGSLTLDGAAASADATPTGNTPDLYPGMPGWLPTGKGQPIPSPDLVNGKPQGVWWSTSYGAGVKATLFVFLPKGIHGSNPRFGGGMLWDVAGQQAAPGANGVGPFSIASGKITRAYDGHRSDDPFATGADGSGKFFKVGAAVFRPALPVKKESLIGTWEVPGTRYVFNSDGTYEFGQVAQGDGWATGGRVSGRYHVDGYLVTLRPDGGAVIVQPMAFAGKGILLVNGLFYKQR